MDVRTLIEKLLEMPQDDIVYVRANDGEYTTADFVKSYYQYANEGREKIEGTFID